MNLMMKNPIYIAVILLLCTHFASAQEGNCERKTGFGGVEICLPVVEGYQECYSSPVVKQLADATEASGNSVLGFYLNDETYDRKDSLSFIRFDDYWKIYVVDQTRDLRVNQEVLEQMKSVLANNFSFKNWEDLISKETEEIGLEVEIGTPVVIKSYSLDEESVSYVMLVEYALEGTEKFTVAMTLNLLVLNEKLVWMAYYLGFEGEETISRLERKSNLLVDKILSGHRE